LDWLRHQILVIKRANPHLDSYIRVVIRMKRVPSSGTEKTR